MNDYYIPDIEKILNELLKDLVRPNNIGPIKVETFDEYMNLMASDEEYDLSAYDFIQINRRMGYFTESFTDISGIDIQTWSRTRDRSVRLMSEVTKRLLASERKTVFYTDSETGELLDFDIDFVQTLNGPDTNRYDLMEETVSDKSFEMHVRVKWKD